MFHHFLAVELDNIRDWWFQILFPYLKSCWRDRDSAFETLFRVKQCLYFENIS